MTQSVVDSNPILARANTAFAQIVLYLEGRGPGTIGPFEYSELSIPDFYLNQVRETPDMRAHICFHFPNPTHKIAYISATIGSHRWTLADNTIISDYVDMQYPSFSYEWSRTSGEKAKLTQLKVALDEDTRAVYIPIKSIAKVSGNLATLRQLPDTLEGVQEILGVSIPFEIDYIARAEKILLASMLEEFAQTLRTNLAS